MPSSRSYKKPRPSHDAGMDREALERSDPKPRKKEPEAELRMPSPIENGLCVRARRSQLEIGQVDVATRVGVSRQWVVALERGKGSIELGLVLKTLEILRLDLRILVWGPPDWAVPLTASSGARARPYVEGRRWRVQPE